MAEHRMSDAERDRVRSAYKARRRAKSWKHEKRTRREVVAEITTALLVPIAVVGFGQNVDTWTDLGLPAIAGLGALVAWEVAIRPMMHFVWTVPEQEHLDDVEAVRGLRDQVSTNTVDIQRLTAVVDDRRKSQHIADQLTGSLTAGYVFSNQAIGDQEDFQKWRKDEFMWAYQTLQELKQLGCTFQELSAFWEAQPADFEGKQASHYSEIVWNHHKTIHARHIDKLREIIDGYSDRPILQPKK